ncbi:MAG: hypothetical protein HQK77_03060, partial [Desulfobacterales bacterium]|nr:hypothetical protein [Desulfobacterales bacterium]
WSGMCSGVDSCIVTMDMAKEVTATFDQTMGYTLSVTLFGTGYGTVISMPFGIDTRMNYNATFAEATTVELFASPDVDSSFMGWGGVCSGFDPCIVTMDMAKDVTATFDQITTGNTLTVYIDGTGSGTVKSIPEEINCGTECIKDFALDTVVELFPIPDIDSIFSGWSGACSGIDTCIVTMDMIKDVTATFDLMPITEYSLTVYIEGTGLGTVTSFPEGINCGTTCMKDFASDTFVELTAVPDSNSIFSGWAGDCSGIDSCIVPIDGIKQVFAIFYENIDIITPVDPDIPPDTNPDIPPDTNPDIPPDTDPDLPPDTNPDATDVVEIIDMDDVDQATQDIFENIEVIDMGNLTSEDRGTIDNVMETTDQITTTVITALNNGEITMEQALSHLQSVNTIIDDLQHISTADQIIAIVNQIETINFSNENMSSELLNYLEILSWNAMKGIIDDVASATDVNAAMNSFSDTQTAQNYLIDNPQMIDELLDMAGVSLINDTAISKTNIENELMLQGYTEESAKQVSGCLPTLIDPVVPIVTGYDDSSGQKQEISPQELLENGYKNKEGMATMDISTTSDTQGIIHVNIRSENGETEQLAMAIANTYYVSECIPEGFYTMSDGSIIYTHDGVASKLIPAPNDALPIIATFQESDFETEINEKGQLLLEQNGMYYVGSFGYGVTPSTNERGRFAAGVMSFDIQGVDPATEAYSILVTYPDGMTQSLAPSVLDMDKFIKTLDTVFGKNYRIDLNTGVIDLVGFGRYKPSYTVDPMSVEELLWYSMNKDIYGIAWNIYDYNNDGVLDVQMMTYYGKQILYQVK